MRRALALVLLLTGCAEWIDPIIEELCDPQDVEMVDDTLCEGGTRIANSVYWDGVECVDLWEYSCHCEGEECDEGYASFEYCEADHDVCWEDPS